MTVSGCAVFLVVFIWHTISSMRKELAPREAGTPLAEVPNFSVIGKIFMSYLQFVTFVFFLKKIYRLNFFLYTDIFPIMPRDEIYIREE